MVLAMLAAAPLVLAAAGCSDDKKSAASTTPPATSSSATPPPNYSMEQVKAGLIAAKDIRPDVREIDVALRELKDGRVPVCSLSGFKLPTDPETTERQFANSTKGPKQYVHAQLIARYQEAKDASSDFEILKKKAKACPSKQKVAPKKVGENRTAYAHDDTWRVEEGVQEGWGHLRGIEQQTIDRASSKYNVYHFTYDYALRGNLLVTTLSIERTEPKESGAPITKRATEVLVKQLKKFG
ncbi:hypothetical protein [Spirillospora sp. CA-294931]|uniref:hypothetical protein n=1 Tax=Spirillospora sp. CA-294931 TaxID=3240042 RepID=UPI003D8B9564